MAVSYMTEEGYKKLQKEIDHLETVERPRISQQIAEARDKGDLSENAEYDAAKEAQGMMEMKISQLKELFLNARILDESKINTDTVQILTKVTLLNTKTKQVFDYTIVSDSEANLKEKKISVSTPIAKGLLGKKAGETVEISVPAGILTLQIQKIALAK
jgi:transcription elongation factor GreA